MISNWTCRGREQEGRVMYSETNECVRLCLKGDTMREEGRITGVKWDKWVCRGLCVCVFLCSFLCVAVWVFGHWSVCFLCVCVCVVPAASQHQRVFVTLESWRTEPTVGRRQAVCGRLSPVVIPVSPGGWFSMSNQREREREPSDWLFRLMVLLLFFH